MPNLLIEIGTEELPDKQILNAAKHLQEQFLSKIESAGIIFEAPKLIATPRRLGLYFTQINISGPSSVEELKGPPKKMCFDDDGNPTKALEGFAVKAGISPSEVDFKDFGKTENAFANVSKDGEKLSDIIASDFPKMLLSYPHPHSMKWDETGISWVRPIRWIVCLLDDKVLPLIIGNVESDRFTRSPRPEKIQPVELSKAEQYFEKLEDMGVYSNYDDRKVYIIQQAEKQVESKDMKPLKDERLLDELAGIVERPNIIIGEFPKEYIDTTPELILKSVLISDLRCIPFIDSNGKLTNTFAIVSNSQKAISETVLAGGKKVLLGKLADAKFFYQYDRKKKLEDFAKNLSGIAFIRNLGNLEDKVNRMVAISDEIETNSSIKKVELITACKLCKADLATSLVREHDELQGLMGGLYALEDGVDSSICEAISSHYLPAGESDPLPKSVLGQTLSLVDKVDSLVNLISSGNAPKGSADPLGVRRFAFTTLRILLDGDIDIDFVNLIKTAAKHSHIKSDTATTDTIEFIQPRLEKLLRDKDYRYDIIRASIEPGIGNIKEVEHKSKAISQVYEKPEFTGIVETAKRLKNILKDWNGDKFDENLFTEDAEREFFKQANSTLQNAKKARQEATNIVDFEQVKTELDELLKLTPHAQKYFDLVMVNVDDEKIRSNRKNYLSWLLAKISEFADFTQIAI